MGQKVHPTSFRLGIIEDWRSRWYANKKVFGDLLVEDEKIRRHINKNYAFAGIPKIEIERRGDEVKVILHTARPGLIIGRKGAEVERLKADIERLVNRTVGIDIKEVHKPELNAQLVAESIAQQLAKRGSFRRTMKRAVDTTMDNGAVGVKVQLSGRLGGAEMARREKESAGKVPLHTLRANIDYGFIEAITSYGRIGTKVWINRGIVDTNEETTDGPDAQAGQVSKVPKGKNKR